ncbi:hypothetical protein RSOLAG1IB_07003 [Rhizoctonia solani AG-1 IB]|uniref:Uncharacterized protein n=1 Tax=Thanatephorus cucumeris (strain AG1-IB / isolate 7/3/14) TaxID=1108050 RepID=A0A0B7FDU0_THACB|nr:hypothetical protein RSOLAG1IB_07003 [Rhizoctonia solani AG-1 IB]
MNKHGDEGAQVNNEPQITAKVEPSSIHTPAISQPESRAASPVVTLPPTDINDSTSPTPAPIRPKAKITSTATVGSLKPPAKPTGPNTAGRRTPASSTVSRGARSRPASTVGAPSKPSFGRPTTPAETMSKRAMSPQLRPGPRIESPEPTSRGGPTTGARTTRPVAKPTSLPLAKSVSSSKSIPSRRSQPPPTPSGKRNKSPVRAPPLTLPRRTASPIRSSLFEAHSPTSHRRVASASASSSVVSGGGEPSASPGDYARARHKLPSSLSSITLTCPSNFPSVPASPPSSTYPALVSQASLPTLDHNQPDSQDSSPELTDMSAPPSAIPHELLSAEEPKRAVASAPVTPIHAQIRVGPASRPASVRPRTSSATVIAVADETTEESYTNDTLAPLNDNGISAPKDMPMGVRIKAKLTATTPPNNPAAKATPRVRPEQLAVPRQRAGSISAGSALSGLATSTLSRASSVRVTSASRILSPPLIRPGAGLGLIVPGANLLIPPGMRSPPISSLSSTSSTSRTTSSSDSSAPATSIDRARTPMDSGLRAKLTAVPSKLGHAGGLEPPDEEGVEMDDSGIDMFEVDDAEQDQREEARSNRKIADLEISNKSLLAINASLESTKSRQAKEIEELKRKLRESRLILPPSAYLALEQKDPLDTNDNFNEDEGDLDDDDEAQIEADESFNRVRGLLDKLMKDAQEALVAKADIPEPKEPIKKPIRVLDVDELQQYTSGDGEIDESAESKATESVTDLAESIDEDSPSALAEKAALLTSPKPASSFTVGIFGGWGNR